MVIDHVAFREGLKKDGIDSQLRLKHSGNILNLKCITLMMLIEDSKHLDWTQVIIQDTEGGWSEAKLQEV